MKCSDRQQYVYKHFFYRVVGLIVWPFIIYLSFFWVHFKILKYSGPGDSFMSPAFQETLQGNELLLNSQGKPSVQATLIEEIRYFDTVTIKHKDTKQLLHSHLENYPLRYDDGRISSQGWSKGVTAAHTQVNRLLATRTTIPTTTGRSYPPRNSQRLAEVALCDTTMSSSFCM